VRSKALAEVGALIVHAKHQLRLELERLEVSALADEWREMSGIGYLHRAVARIDHQDK
jgi:hypothetical protein